MTPQWWLFVTPTKRDAELARARRSLRATASSQAANASPSCASTTAAPPLLRDDVGTAAPFTRPLRRWVAYCATRLRPCEASPCASASTSARAVGCGHRGVRAGRAQRSGDQVACLASIATAGHQRSASSTRSRDQRATRARSTRPRRRRCAASAAGSGSRRRRAGRQRLAARTRRAPRRRGARCAAPRRPPPRRRRRRAPC